MAGVRPYYAQGSLSAAFYDVVTAADGRLEGDIAVYAGLAGPEASVLELGVGSGRVAVALALRGLGVTGVDVARSMLDQAETRKAMLAPAVAARVALRLGDMTSLDLKQAFDLVICPYFGLAHLPVGAAWRNVFGVAARHLRPGGLAAFHLPLIGLMRQAAAPDPSAAVLDQPLPDRGRLRLYVRERRFRPELGRLDQVIDYEALDARGQPVRRSSERLAYYMADPTPFAAGADLAPDQAPIDVGGVGEIWVFRKA